MKQRLSFLIILLSFVIQASATAFSAPAPSIWPPQGAPIRCPVTRDAGISSVGDEKLGNLGGAERLKLKSQQEFVLFDIAPAPLKRKAVTGALLHVRSASSQHPLARVGVSTVAGRWEEGSSRRYRPQIGSSCFDQSEYRQRDWAYKGSTVMDVVFGRGHTIWKFADCTPPDENGWQTCPVDPDVVAARAAGLSYGFCLYDEVGSTWSVEDGRFVYNYFPNRFFYSREKSGSEPWLEVWVKEADAGAPGKVTDVEVETEGFPPGEALATWEIPAGKILGFLVDYSTGSQNGPMPRYLTPMADEGRRRARMHIQDLPFGSGEDVVLTIRAVDSAGNVGLPFEKTIRLSNGAPFPAIAADKTEPFPREEKLPEVGGLKVSILDLLDKVDPQSGELIPSKGAGYKGGNHLYSASQRLVRLQGARNETVVFQLNLEGKAKDVSISYDFPQSPLLKTRLYEFAYVNASKNGRGHPLPDPLVPIRATISIPSKAGQIEIPDQKNHSVICELYIPREAPPGKKRGLLKIFAGGESIVLDVDLTVWNFTLPNKLSFVPEMNAYGTVSPYRGYEYYRMAHEHRTCLNRLPYGWDGRPGFAPVWDGRRFHWNEWDREVGPLLDGSAFKDLPRKGEPVDVMYLPFNENWPVGLSEHYRPSYWADEAFDGGYSKELKNAFEVFSRHCAEHGWRDTTFQFYLNNKVYYRKQFPQASAPWIFDEPVNTQDFWALRWYGLLFQSAVAGTDGTRMWFRGDVSYSQFGRNILWGVMDVEYLGDNNRHKTRMKRDESILAGPANFAEYGTANPIDASNAQPALWCLAAWSKGAMGVLPWQTIGDESSWKKGEQTALFYSRNRKAPCPSVRLKAFTRGQQDVEYMTLFSRAFNVPRYAVAVWLGERVDIRGSVEKSSSGDAGHIVFSKGDGRSLWKIRRRIGSMLSNKAPAYRRSLVKREKRKWDPQELSDLGYVPTAAVKCSRR